MSAMNDTLKQVKLCIDENLKDKSNEDLCILYQKTKKDKYFAEVYKRLFGDLFNIYKTNAPYLEEEIAATASLELVSELMQQFDASRGIKFITLCHNGFYRRLHGEKQPFTRKKRRCLYKLLSLNSSKYLDSDNSLIDIIEDTLSINKINNSLTKSDILSLKFEPIEIYIINYIIEGAKIADLSHILNIDSKEVKKSINKIRKKLLSINFR